MAQGLPGSSAGTPLHLQGFRSIQEHTASSMHVSAAVRMHYVQQVFES